MNQYACSLVAHKFCGLRVITRSVAAVIEASNEDEATGKAYSLCKEMYKIPEYSNHLISVLEVPDIAQE